MLDLVLAYLNFIYYAITHTGYSETPKHIYIDKISLTGGNISSVAFFKCILNCEIAQLNCAIKLHNYQMQQLQ